MAVKDIDARSVSTSSLNPNRMLTDRKGLGAAIPVSGRTLGARARRAALTTAPVTPSPKRKFIPNPNHKSLLTDRKGKRTTVSAAASTTSTHPLSQVTPGSRKRQGFVTSKVSRSKPLTCKWFADPIYKKY